MCRSITRRRPDRIRPAQCQRCSQCVAVVGPDIEVVPSVAAQPLSGMLRRLEDAFEFLGTPLAAEISSALDKAITQADAASIQRLLDSQVRFVVELNPESRVKARRGPGSGVAPASRLHTNAGQGDQPQHGDEGIAHFQSAGRTGLCRDDPVERPANATGNPP